MSQTPPPALIVGHGKSGTTLVQALLDSHPQLAVFPLEPYVFGRLVLPTLGKSAEDRRAHATTFLRKLHEHPLGWLAEIPFDELDTTYRRHVEAAGGDYRAYHAGLVLAWAELTGIDTSRLRRWVEKTPEYEKYADYVFAQWPDARMLHVMRDPRDNFGSYKRFRIKHHPHRRAVAADSFARRWRESERLARRNLTRFGSRYRILRYEDLVHDPATRLGELADFFGIDLDPALEQPTLAGRPWGGNSMHGERFTGIDTSSVGRWRSTLDEATVTALEARLATPMRRLGYELTTRPSLTVHGRAWLDNGTDQLRALWHRLRPTPPRRVLTHPDSA
ncbi:MAG: sulfotransferase [Acidobacteriota bacterium]